MKKNSIFIFSILFSLLFNSGCRGKAGKEPGLTIEPAAIEINTKPASSFNDTLFVHSRAAVFYYPDSAQLEKIKAATNKEIFESMQHEYLYQLKYAHKALKDFPATLQLIDAKNTRYLAFKKKNEELVCIDLNQKSDAYGLILFDPSKNPKPADLTNTETEAGLYFSIHH
jgi:hypothetical protein